MCSSVDRLAISADQTTAQPELLAILSKHAGNLIAVTDFAGKTLYQSLSHQKILGYTHQYLDYGDRCPDQNVAKPDQVHKAGENYVVDNYWYKIHPADRQHFRAAMEDVAQTGEDALIDCRFMHVDGNWLAFETKISLLEKNQDQLNLKPQQVERSESGRLLILSNDINDLTLADKVIRARDAQIKNLFEQDRLIAAIAQRIHQSLNLEDILNTTVTELRHLLKCDRVVIYQFKPDGSGEVTVESVAEPWDSVLGVTQNCNSADKVMMRMRLAQFQPSIINDINQANLTPCHYHFLENLQVQANLVVPIVLKPIDDDQPLPEINSAVNNPVMMEPGQGSGFELDQRDYPTSDNELNYDRTWPLDPDQSKAKELNRTNELKQQEQKGKLDKLAELIGLNGAIKNESQRLLDIRDRWLRQKNKHKLWGLIIAHQCTATRNWQADHVALLQKLSDQVAIAIMQSDLLAKERSQRLALAQQNVVLGSAFRRIKNAAESKRQFLANISHEIRSPMNGILGIAELLADTNLDDQQLSLLQTLQASGQNLLQIINDILDYSRSQAKRISIVKKEFNLIKCIEGVVDLAAIQAHDKGIEVFSYIDPDVPPMLVGDVGRLRQVLTNLVTNAVKFTESGHISISVQSQPVGESCLVSQTAIAEDGESTLIQADTPLLDLETTQVNLKFTISDTGCGISETNQRELFEAFVQFSPEVSQKHGGTGLGLTISKQIVAAMGGSIGVSSQIGQGSSFWVEVSLPIANLEPQLSLAKVILTESKISSQTLTMLRQLKVLLVADNDNTLALFNQHAQFWQLQLDQVKDGMTALAKLKQANDRNAPYDVAILDLQLSQISAEMLGQGILTDPDLAQTKLAIATFINQAEIANHLIEQGFAAMLIKPVKIGSLIECLRDAINQPPSNQPPSNQPPNKQAQSDPRLDPPPQTPARSDAQLGHKPGLDVTSSRAKQAELDPPVAQPDRSPATQPKPKILVVEDNPISQNLVTMQLKQLGYPSDCVSNGEEALTQLDQEYYPIVLMDCQMPVMDGYTATQAIRHKENQLRESGGEPLATIVIAVTANAFEADRKVCLDAGMDDYLKKPVMKQDLANALERWQQQVN
ncbi:GAF sensor hybrid histidine kinase [Thalassoporum mexicanum PCC 7367]|uniref:response regulator n=1 Tax=Thalassoporum mexicanum TaxID=3457544 RepID=UPI00029FCA47|nr:response regulator [Pseudanabaena sp. PCC 7367]AFY71329.1 GAF sensor hybrid histidine kinase [Pseudanabaena sp. PCC 7367]